MSRRQKTEEKIENLRAQLAQKYSQQRDVRNDKEIYDLSLQLDKLITRYMKTGSY